VTNSSIIKDGFFAITLASIGVNVRVILIRGNTSYDVVNVFLDHVMGALSSRGYKPLIIDVMNVVDLGAEIEHIVAQGPVEFAFSFGLFGEYRSQDNLSIGEIIEGPHVIPG
jgi:hypothetical protein